MLLQKWSQKEHPQEVRPILEFSYFMGGYPPHEKSLERTHFFFAREREGAAAPSHKQGRSGGAAGPPSMALILWGVPYPIEMLINKRG